MKRSSSLNPQPRYPELLTDKRKTTLHNTTPYYDQAEQHSVLRMNFINPSKLSDAQ